MTVGIRVGVSSCLLGEAVRYDGGHKLDRYVRDTLGASFDIVPVCPEVGLGLGVPRETIGLIGDPMKPRLIGQESGVDLTEQMEAWCEMRIGQLSVLGISGFVLKARSPSCGRGGLFTLALSRCLPELPVVMDEDLRSSARRELFLRQVMDGV